jgi:predicted acylesterase/phospholipase RssA
MSDFWFPRTLIIGPGGVKGLKALGFLAPLEDNNLFQKTDTYCGVSIGALIALLMVSGYKIREIINEAVFWEIFKEIELLDIITMAEKKGILSTESIRKKVGSLITNKLGNIPTLHGLYLKTGKALSIVSLNITDQKTVFMNPFTHGHVNCMDAVLYSMNIPFLFYQLFYEGKLHIDGALADPYPISYFDDGKTNILGIFMKRKHILHHPLQRQKVTNTNTLDNTIEFCNKILTRCNSPSESPFSLKASTQKINYTTIQEQVSKIMDAMLEQRHADSVSRSSESCVHVVLEVEKETFLGFQYTLKEKVELIVEGYLQGIYFIRTWEKKGIRSCDKPKMETYIYPNYYLLEEEESLEQK